MSMNEGITLDDMEDQTQNTLHQVQSQVNGNSRLASDTGINQNQDDAEDLEELEQSLQALDENLDRSSPDLWPDHIPGVGQYLPATPYQDSDTPRGGEGGSGVTGGVLHNMTRDEMEIMTQPLEQCVVERRLECVYYGYTVHTNKTEQLEFRRSWSPHYLYPSDVLLYFCGHHPECSKLGSSVALQLAKHNVDNNFAVVGLLEHLDETMTVLENRLPQFFSGLGDAYKEQSKTSSTLSLLPCTYFLSMFELAPIKGSPCIYSGD